MLIIELAYIGPGLGIGTIILVLVVLLIVLVSIGMILWTPLKRIFGGLLSIFLRM